MNEGIVSLEVRGVAFSMFPPEEIRRLSVKQIENPVLLDVLGHPNPGGLYDAALGPVDKDDICKTCQLNFVHCPGHMGHIDLVLPVYNPILFLSMFRLLRSVCTFCHRLKQTKVNSTKLLLQLELLDRGFFIESMEFGLNSISAPTDEALDDSSAHKQVEKRANLKTLAMHREYEHIITQAGKNPSVNASLTDRANQKHVQAYRTNIVEAFMKVCSLMKTCSHCQASSRSYRRVNQSKIFKKPLGRRAHSKCNLKERNVGNEMGKWVRAEVFRRKKDLKEDAAESVQEDRDDSDDSDDAENEEDDGESVGHDDTSDSDDQDGVQDDDGSHNVVDISVNNIQDTFLSPLEARRHLQLVWDGLDGPLLNSIFGAIIVQEDQTFIRKSTQDMFFVSVLAVPPTRFRPASQMGNTIFENHQNVHYGAVLKANVAVAEEDTREDVGKNGTSSPSSDISLFDKWVSLQDAVNELMDSSLALSKAGQQVTGVRQTLEKKEGLFRKHMMGKRVNYAARSVISPDPYIGTDEIGVPSVFATRLTFPEPVTPWNVHELRQAVINGPTVHPGATHVVSESNHKTSLAALSRLQRVALAQQLLTPSGDDENNVDTSSQKTVLRHLRNGDMLLVNRQPTLHKPSLMAHRAHVLPKEKTIRMHYANCNTYNADFDGDEMNIHFPQSEMGRAEALTIALNNFQYCAPTSGSPLRGLIQDHVVVGVSMTSQNTFYTRAQFQQLLFAAIPNANFVVKTPPPAILKPKPMWTGKQLVSSLLQNLTRNWPQLNLVSTAKIPAKSWGGSSARPGGISESNILFVDGELLHGVLDKSQFGASAYGLVHACHELYGAQLAGDLLTALGRLFTAYVQTRGFTLGTRDILLTANADAERKNILVEAVSLGKEVAAGYVQQKDENDSATLTSNLERVCRSVEETAGLDAAMKTRINKLTSKVIAACLPDGQLFRFPENNLSLMTLSGAKGSAVNFAQISCLLGQQELEGKRVPVMVSGKTLPSFRAWDPSARAGGYVMGRFLTGIKPQEYFFHCMAGREGLVDTAVKTSRSGYLQRCLIKHMEGLKVSYDNTVRDSDGSIVQFCYGEDAIDVGKVSFLNKFSFLSRNYTAMLRRLNARGAQSALDFTKAPHMMSKCLKKPGKYDPVLSRLNPHRYLGATSEKFARSIEEFINDNPDDVIDNTRLTASKFRSLAQLKYRDSLVEAGEAVGLLAAQGIGEPSTQMTLNTFHFAGRGEVNVTLGIPRLREILLTAAARIKTPVMTIPLHPEEAGKMSKTRHTAAATLMHSLSRVTLENVLQTVKLTEKIVIDHGERYRSYRVRLELIDPAKAKERHNVSTSSVFRSIETTLLRLMDVRISKLRVAAGKSRISSKVVRSGGADKDDDSPDAAPAIESDSDNDDAGSESGEAGGDATMDSQMRKKKAMTSYDDDDGNESDESDASHSSDEESNDGDGGHKKMSKLTAEKEEEAAAAAESMLKRRIKERESFAKNAQRREIRINTVLDLFPSVKVYNYDDNGCWAEITYRFPLSDPKLLMVSLIESLASSVVIRHVPGVQRCFQLEGAAVPTLQTEGINLRHLWSYAGLVDVNRLQTNDITAVLNTYGVEAARSTIENEVAGVFKVYGIGIDRRHLSLVADYMTFEGGYTAFNRIGINSNPSSFLKMSFETTMNFLKTAVLSGDYEPLDSPSARLVLGRVVEGGTGAFDVLQPLKTTTKHV